MKPLAMLVVSMLVTGCLSAELNGYDPNRYAAASITSAPDPETEPLPPSPKRRILDPRGFAVAAPPPEVPAVDAGVAAPKLPEGEPAATCGTSRDSLCPMQAFMHSEMATVHTKQSLTTAFTLVAGLSPDDAWAWTAIATRGAALANEGNIPAAKAQCTACHDVYREAYKRTYRARPL